MNFSPSKHFQWVLSISLMLLVHSAFSFQGAAKKLNFQGSLYENGEAVNGTRNFSFSIVLDGSTWTESHANVQVVDGLYAVVLGSINALPEDLFYKSDERRLTIQVGNNVLGTTSIFAPFSPKNYMLQADSALFIREAEKAQFMPQIDSALFIREAEKAQFMPQIDSALFIRETEKAQFMPQIDSALFIRETEKAQFMPQSDSALFLRVEEKFNGGELSLAGVKNLNLKNDSSGLGGVEIFGKSSELLGAFKVDSTSDNTVQFGTINLKSSEGHTHVVLDRSDSDWPGAGRLRLYDPGGKENLRLGSNFTYSGALMLYDSLGSMSSIFTGFPAGGSSLVLYDSLENINFSLSNYRNGGSYISMRDKINDTTSAITYQLNGGNITPWTNMISRETDGATKGRVVTGVPPGYADPGILLTSASYGDQRARFIGGDTPYLRMYGKDTIFDKNSSAYFKNDIISINTLQNGAGNNHGSISIGNSQNYGRTEIGFYESASTFFPRILLLSSYDAFDGSNYYNLPLMDINVSRDAGNTIDNSTISLKSLKENESTAKEFVFLQTNSAAGDKRWGQIILNGGSSTNFVFDSRSDISNGDDLARMSIHNSTSNAMAYFEVANSTSGQEWGNISLFGTTANHGISISGARDILDDGTQISSMISLYDDNTGGFIDLYGTGGANFSGNVSVDTLFNDAVITSSDRRLKSNIQTLNGALAKVNQLRGVSFSWKNDDQSREKIGFIAQEVEEVYPQLVATKANGFKGVNYAEMTAILVEAVKELNAEIVTLKKENKQLRVKVNDNESLQLKVSSLENRLTQIEALINTKATGNNQN